MKKFNITKIDPGSCMVSGNELPLFTSCLDDRKFNYSAPSQDF